MEEVVLVINPGSTSTKLGLFDKQGEIETAVIEHDRDTIANFPDVVDQIEIRLSSIESYLKRWFGDGAPAAVVGRGGLLRPCKGGIYRVNKEMLKDLSKARYGNHASNLGAMLADRIAKRYAVEALIADPVTTDEFIPESRISGVPEIERKCRAHALNMKACFREVAMRLKKDPENTNCVVAHLGGGFSIGALMGGSIIDVNDGLLGMGPFSTERAGALPIGGVMDLCFSGKYNREKLIAKFSRESGLKGYLGTNDLREILARIESGDEYARLIFRAMVHQIAKEIGAMAVVLKGKLDGIILTGGLCKSEELVREIKDYIAFMAPVYVFPGENELSSLADAGFRALKDPEIIQKYKS